ncbi:MAG: hypothetical protein GY842_18080 [bacterium]|nr:hypothetical protein [bacterium]
MYLLLPQRAGRLGAVLVAALLVRNAAAQNAAPLATDTVYASFSLYQDEPETTLEKTEIVTYDEEALASPFSFDVTYYLYSDYVFRGINFSEYPTEGREKPNHQLTTDISVDVGALFGQQPGTCGTFSFGTFFEWYAMQKVFDPEHGGQNLQEVDYVLSWAYDLESIATSFTLGYTFYAFPNAKSINTQEWWFTLEHNDAWMWKWMFPENEDGVLNPSFLFAQDVEVTHGGCWMEFGISHDFELFENFTLTPSMIFAMDHRYLDPLLGTGSNGASRLAYVQYGITTTYDLTPALRMPDWAGALTLSGFLYFNDALGNPEDNRLIQDELFGGMSIGWSWGG